MMQHDTPYWRRHVCMTAALFLLWISVIVLTVASMSWWHIKIWGWPLPYWLASQGSLLVFGLIVWLYAHFSDAKS